MTDGSDRYEDGEVHLVLHQIVGDSRGQLIAHFAGRVNAAHERIRARREFTQATALNQSLERCGRVDDFFELAQAMCRDALVREESCGGHFRGEHQYDDGEAKRDDENFAHVTAWEWTGDALHPEEHREALTFEEVHLAVRSYK